MSLGALGMLETYGLIAAVEGLDAAVKAANVTLCGFKYVSGGMVAFFVTGDTGAVRAAISAGEAAAAKVGRVISTHIIPRPAESTGKISAALEKPAGRKRGTGIHKRDFPTKAVPVQAEPAEPAPKPEEQSVSEPISTVEPVVQTPPVVMEAPKAESAPKAKAAAGVYTREELEARKTVDLRKLAREFLPEIGLTRIEIRDAKKETLIQAILALQNNG